MRAHEFTPTSFRMSKRIIIAGGSGFLGQALTPVAVESGYEVVILGRGTSGQRGRVHHLQWDGRTLADWARALDGAAAVVNLTGNSVNVRHTP